MSFKTQKEKINDMKLSLARVPLNEEESESIATALTSSGSYPAGLNGCFTVGIKGGCGPDCWVYQEGNCEVADTIDEE